LTHSVDTQQRATAIGLSPAEHQNESETYRTTY